MVAMSEAAIFRRIIAADHPALPRSVARMIPKWEFSGEDRERMRGLLEKAQAGTLTRAEKSRAENYERIGHFLSTLKSQARTSLKRKSAAAISPRQA
jgi:hypothetical protein